jgi:hypothetical protein
MRKDDDDLQDAAADDDVDDDYGERQTWRRVKSQRCSSG